MLASARAVRARACSVCARTPRAGMDTQTHANLSVTVFAVAYWLCGVATLGYYHTVHELTKNKYEYNAIGCVLFVALWPIAAAYAAGAVLCMTTLAIINRIRGNK